MRARAARIIVGLVLATQAAGADEPDTGPRGLAVAWRLERVILDDGRALEGLVLDVPGDDDVAFVEVVRRPGRPMHLVARRLPADRVRDLQRLPPADHEALVARVEAFRTGGREERAAAAALRLIRRGEDRPWEYDGPWFTLESSAGQPLTRQAIVRLENLFDAFEQLLPRTAAAEPPRRLAVRLCGSHAEYAAVRGEEGVRGDNPAFYLPERGRLVAGSDVPVVLAEAELAADGLDATAARQRVLDDEVTRGLRHLATELESQGIPPTQRAEIVARTRARWQREKGATLARVEAARKANEVRVAEAREVFLTALAHEAWHAYADIRLAAGGLPAWLDEGLAQVFEAGLLEAGELRLDAPDPRRLARLADLLTGSEPVSLVPLLAGGERQFLVGHGTPAAASRHAYLIAWGVAYDLALGAPVLTADSFGDLAAERQTDGSEAARLERLVGMALPKYEEAWRGRMLALSRRPPATSRSAGGRATGPPAPATDAPPPDAPDR